MFTSFRPLKVSFNPYPARCRLPGDVTPERRNLPGIEGMVRRIFIHALTFHEIPSDVDNKIDRFPSEDALVKLNPLQRHSLSFSVYSVKQMVAAGTISADSAWGLFDYEWGKLAKADENYLTFMARTDFLRQVGKLLGKNRIRNSNQLYEIEFFARAGRAGLAQIERFGPWSQALVFDSDNSMELPGPLKDEYSKALWLEMRLIEGQVGISGLNQDVGVFGYNRSGWYNHKRVKVSCSVNAYDFTSGCMIDNFIKGEIGHWMFSNFHLSANGIPYPQANYSWVEELMDSMNASAFTTRVNQMADAGEGTPLPPEGEVFFRGAHSSYQGINPLQGSDHFPFYPPIFDDDMIFTFHEPHAIADVFEEDIRRHAVVKAFREGEIKSRDIFSTYRKAGLFFALAHLEGNDWRELLHIVYESFDPREIRAAYRSYKKRALAVLDNGNVVVRPGGSMLDDETRQQAIEIIKGSRFIR